MGEPAENRPQAADSQLPPSFSTGPEAGRRSTTPAETAATAAGKSKLGSVSGEYGPLPDVLVEDSAQGAPDGDSSPREGTTGPCMYWQGGLDAVAKRTAHSPFAGSPPQASSGGDHPRQPEAGAGDNLLQAPLRKLWELERLEMARHREELRNVRGELRSTGPGEHSRYREEQAARQELQQVIRSLIRSSNPEHRFTLETLLRAIEAGHEEAISSPLVQQFLSASRKKRSDRLEGHRRCQAGDLKAKASALLLCVSLAVAWRRLQLGRRIQRAAGSLAGLSHSLWSSHLAQAMVPANRAAVGVQRLLSRPDQPPPDLASEALAGCNARMLDNPRVWYRPGTWFSRRRTRTLAAARHPLETSPVQQLSVQSPSPPWLAGTAPTPPPRTGGTRPQSVDLDPVRPMQSIATLTPPGVQPPVPSARITTSASDQNLNRRLVDSPPLVSMPATHSMPTSPKHSLQVNGLWDAAPSSSSAAAFVRTGPPRPPLARKAVAPKADYLTAPTCSFKAWQSSHTAEAALAAIDCAAASGDGSGGGPLTASHGGVSFRTTVDDAAELRTNETPPRSLAKDLPQPAGSLSALA